MTQNYHLLLLALALMAILKTVWITGASAGIGKALAIAFSKEGANLILSARRKNELFWCSLWGVLFRKWENNWQTKSL